MYKQKERLGQTPKEHLGGFRGPVVLIESQSAPILMGDPAEQAYMRGFGLCGGSDVVVTDFPLNRAYVEDYLRGLLGLSLPEFVEVPNVGARCLSGNIVTIPESVDLVKRLASGRRIQFFNVTPTELLLVRNLGGGVEATCGDIDQAIHLGSKTGFRRVCECLGLPVPRGYVCSDLDDSLAKVKHLFDTNAAHGVMIKAENGTGGTELKSNLWFEKKPGESLTELRTRLAVALASFGEYLGEEWAIEEWVEGEDGSIHVYIKDGESAEPAFVLGSISVDNSYVGGYWPFEMTPQQQEMCRLVDDVYVKEMQRRGILGHHCLDFRGGYFLEDNIRPGALDFVDGLVKRVMTANHPGVDYCWYHKHIATSGSTTFERVWEVLGDLADPHNENGWFVLITNQEVLPHGRSLDMTVVVKENSQVSQAEEIFGEIEEYLKDKI